MPPIELENTDLIPAGTDLQTDASAVQPIAAITPAEPVVVTKETKHYWCTLPNASIHRKDGTRISFVFGHFESNLKADKDFLDAEIEGGHPSIRYATAQEIHAAKMKKDPVGTIRAQMKQEVGTEVEDRIRAEVEAEFRAKYGIPDDSVKVAGTDSSKRLAALRASRETHHSGSGTLIMSGSAAPLKGIQSTAGIADAAASSGR